MFVPVQKIAANPTIAVSEASTETVATRELQRDGVHAERTACCRFAVVPSRLIMGRDSLTVTVIPLRSLSLGRLRISFDGTYAGTRWHGLSLSRRGTATH